MIFARAVHRVDLNWSGRACGHGGILFFKSAHRWSVDTVFGFERRCARGTTGSAFPWLSTACYGLDASVICQSRRIIF